MSDQDTIARLTAQLADSRRLLGEAKQREAALEARLSQSVENGQSYHPEFCPVTGRSFFMTIEGEDGKMVATYGGPFDSYTIPEWDHEEKEFRSERYDHDAGHWVEGGEPYDFIIVDEQEYFDLQSQLAAAREARVHGVWSD